MPTQPDEKPTFTIPEVARFLGIGRNTLYDAVARGEVPVLRIGRRILVTRVALDRWLEGARDVR